MSMGTRFSQEPIPVDPQAPVAFLSVLPPFRGGIADFGQRLINALSNFRTVIPVNFEVQYPSVFFPGSSQIRYGSEAATGKRLFHPLNPVKWKRTAEEIVASGAGTVVIAYWHAFFSPGLWFVARQLKKNGVRTIGLFHNVSGHDPFPLESHLLRGFVHALDVGVALSAENSTKLTKLGCRRVIPLFHPVEPLECDEAGNHMGIRKPVILHLGLIRPYKGVDIFLKALDRIEAWQDRVEVILAGENYMDERELFSGISLSTKTSIKFENRFLTETEMNGLLCSASLVVLPYRTASQSGILAQAIGAGKSAAVSELPGLSEYITEGKTGWVLPAGDIEAWETFLQRWMTGGLKADASALKEAQNRYSWARFASKLAEEISKEI